MSGWLCSSRIPAQVRLFQVDLCLLSAICRIFLKCSKRTDWGKANSGHPSLDPPQHFVRSPHWAKCKKSVWVWQTITNVDHRYIQPLADYWLDMQKKCTGCRMRRAAEELANETKTKAESGAQRAQGSWTDEKVDGWRTIVVEPIHKPHENPSQMKPNPMIWLIKNRLKNKFWGIRT